MPLAPKLAATVVVAATVATLSVLSSPAYADSGASSPDGGGGSNVEELVDDVESILYKCRSLEAYNIPVISNSGLEVCVAPPTP